ncbi:hypothetical protein O1611_g2330 [Lasiodiplodia mahajangana]|uniref:Uncharacterized protein n=1 Tax=Lasiodiplodia mahajangana TaxID=1108764 RepID=A0ACC2JV58_9PEZI|nr:hypothetical protein O1611_g2330 [Lasiodiplodia mahajangana]
MLIIRHTHTRPDQQVRELLPRRARMTRANGAGIVATATSKTCRITTIRPVRTVTTTVTATARFGERHKTQMDRADNFIGLSKSVSSGKDPEWQMRVEDKDVKTPRSTAAAMEEARRNAVGTLEAFSFVPGPVTRARESSYHINQRMAIASATWAPNMVVTQTLKRRKPNMAELIHTNGASLYNEYPWHREETHESHESRAKAEARHHSSPNTSPYDTPLDSSLDSSVGLRGVSLSSGAMALYHGPELLKCG